MVQVQTIRGREFVPGGYNVTIETSGVYAGDAQKHVRTVFVPASAVNGKTLQERQQAVFDAATDDPIRELLGATIAAPAATTETLITQIRAKYTDWWMWKNIAEAVANESPGNFNRTTASGNKAAALLVELDTLLDAWRVANPGTPGIPRPNGIAS